MSNIRNIARICFVSLAVSLPCLPATSEIVGQASELIRDGRFLEAHQLLQPVLGNANRDPRFPTLDGVALSRLGRQEEARQSYENALRLAPAYLPALEGAAQLAFQGRRPEAAALLTRVATAQPADETAHAMLAALALERGDCSAAESEWSRSEHLIAQQATVLEQRGACQLRLGHPASAIPIFETLHNLSPANASAQYDLGLSQFQAGQYRNAIESLSANPAQARDAAHLDLLADAFEHNGNTEAAISTLRQAIVAYPDSTRLYLHFADICLSHTSFQSGVDMVNAGIARLSRDPSLYLARGILLVQLAHYDAAQEDFSRAEALDPRAGYGAALGGMTKLQQNKLPEAVGDIRRHIESKPGDAYLRYLLAESLLREGAVPGSSEFAEAIKQSQRAVALDPKLGAARDTLGRLYLQSGNLNAAIEQSRAAIAADPSDLTALYHLIGALRRAGKTTDIPPLARKLAAMRAAAQEQEIKERRYRIVTSEAQ